MCAYEPPGLGMQRCPIVGEMDCNCRARIRSLIRELPDMMSASEGGRGYGKADVVREVA